jgi:predicted HD phosphohydrolase
MSQANDPSTRERPGFHAMREGTAEDWQRIAASAMAFREGLPDRVLAHLRLLDGDYGGFAVDRLTHSLQSACLAERDGRDEEYVVCALLHDIGDTLCSYNHPDVASAILRPFVSEKNLWMVSKHFIFQGYYYFHLLGGDRDLREEYRGHEWFDYTAEFCEEYDQCAFDPAFDTAPLEHFEPMLRRVFAQPRPQWKGI